MSACGMQRVMEDTSDANSIELYLERCKGDLWTVEMKDRSQKDLELLAPFKNDLKKKICLGDGEPSIAPGRPSGGCGW